MKESEPVDRDRLGVITGALLLALALSRLLQMPARPLNLGRLGLDVVLSVSSGALIAGIIAGMAVAGMTSLVHSHPRARQEPIDHTLMYAIMPTLWACALAFALPQLQNPLLWAAALLAGGVVFALILALEYAAVGRQPKRSLAWQWAYMACIHLTALAVLTVIYAQRAPSIVASLLVWLGMTLLATRFCWSNAGKLTEAAIYGAIVGILMAQMAWAINYWRLSNLQGGLLLFVCFYVLAGLIQQQRLHRLSRQTVVEYGVAAVLAALFALLILT